MQRIFKRTLAGILTGICGSVIFLMLVFISSIFNQASLFGARDTIKNYYFQFFLIAMIVFMSILITNLLTAIIFKIFDKTKYGSLKESITPILIAHLAIQVIITPIYLTFAIMGNFSLYVTIMLQVVFSILITQLILECLANYKNMLIQSFSLILTILASLLIVLFFVSITNSPIILGFCLILMLGFIGFGSGVADSFVEIHKEPLIINGNEQAKEHISILKKSINLEHDYSEDFDG